MIFIPFLLWIGFSGVASAQQIQRNLEFQKYAGEEIDNKSIDEICCKMTESLWKPAHRISTSYNHAVIWLKLPPLEPGAVLEIPQIADKITLFERTDQEEKWTAKISGDTVALSKRAMNVAEMAFILSGQSMVSTERFLKIEQPSSVTYSIDYWDIESFEKSVDQRFLLRILLLGFCLAMILFNFVVSIVTREKTFLFNAATTCCTVAIAMYLSGQPAYWFWPERPELNNQLLILAMGGVSLFATQFISSFLEDSSVDRRVLTGNRWFGAFQFLISLSVLYAGSRWLHAALLIFGAFSIVFQLGLVLYSLMKGDRQTLPMLVPLSIIGVGIVLIYFRTIFALDMRQFNYHFFEIAIALEALAFSLILAARIRFFAARAAQVERQIDKLQVEAAQRFSDLQDSERSRMAGDLHDSIGHGLAIAMGQLETVNKYKKLPIELTHRLDHIRLVIKEAISETRRISHALHPAWLDHLGMQKGLQSMFDDLQASEGIECEVVIDCASDLLTREEKTQISRVVQEAISNIVKHSQAKKCWLSIIQDQDGLHISIEDNGIGKQADNSSEATEHLGLVSIEQRVKRLGGELSPIPKKGGFRIAFSFVPQQLRTK